MERKNVKKTCSIHSLFLYLRTIDFAMRSVHRFNFKVQRILTRWQLLVKGCTLSAGQINPYLTNGFSHHYCLIESTFIFRGIRRDF